MARQPDAGRHKPAAGQLVGEPVAGTAPAALSVDHRGLLHRRLLDHKFSRRCDNRGWLWPLRLLAGQARLRASTAGPRLRARAADGGEPAPRYADLARRRHRVHHAADLGRADGDGVRAAGDRGFAIGGLVKARGTRGH